MNTRTLLCSSGTLLLFTTLCLAQQTALQKQDTALAPPKNFKSKLAPGYTIPIVDISGEKERQVIVDREPGQYLGHPTTLLLEDNKTILTVYPKGHGRGAIVYKRSTDGGKTWSGRLPTPKSWETSMEVPTLHRVIDANGKKRIIMFSGLYPIRMAVTEDDGANWSELKPIGDFGGVVTMSTVIDLKTPGHYLAFFHDDGRFIRGGSEAKYTVKSPHSDHTSPAAKPWRFWVYTTLSKDGGLTWSMPAPIAMLPDASLCEPGVLRSPDGKQIAVLLRENSRKYNSFVIFSNDEGLTWSEPRELPAALTGDRHTAKYGPDGRLFISFRDTTHVSPTKGDWVGWVGTYDDIVKGTEGQYRIRIMDNTKGADCTYPGVELLPDGTFVTTTYGHWTEAEPAYVVCVRFKLEELDKKLPQR
ncbi:MAG TPA: sialidase family protein [Prosthecobacter sp.]|nr:sialidase family protein [Prosthecobacter sp.]